MPQAKKLTGQTADSPPSPPTHKDPMADEQFVAQEPDNKVPLSASNILADPSNPTSNVPPAAPRAWATLPEVTSEEAPGEEERKCDRQLSCKRLDLCYWQDEKYLQVQYGGQIEKFSGKEAKSYWKQMLRLLRLRLRKRSALEQQPELTVKTEDSTDEFSWDELNSEIQALSRAEQRKSHGTKKREGMSSRAMYQRDILGAFPT